MKPSEDQVGGSHYKTMPIQPHYFCHVNKLGALEANVIKYICRHAVKNGKADLLKARHYIDLLLEWEYGEVGESKGGLLPDHSPKPPDVLPTCQCGRLLCKVCNFP